MKRKLYVSEDFTEPLVDDPYLKVFDKISDHPLHDSDSEDDNWGLKEKSMEQKALHAKINVRREEQDRMIIRKIEKIPNFSIRFEPSDRMEEIISGHNIVTLSCRNRRSFLLKWLIKKYGTSCVHLSSSLNGTPLQALVSSLSDSRFNYRDTKDWLTTYEVLLDSEPSLLYCLCYHYPVRLNTILSFISREAAGLNQKSQASRESPGWQEEQEERRSCLLNLLELGVRVIQDGGLLYPYPFTSESEKGNDCLVYENLSNYVLHLPRVVLEICRDYLRTGWIQILALQSTTSLPPDRPWSPFLHPTQVSSFHWQQIDFLTDCISRIGESVQKH